jgi:hypothetical protein
MQLLVLVCVKAIFHTINEHTVDFLLEAAIDVGVGAQGPHKASHSRRRCIGRGDNPHFTVPSGGCQSWLHLFNTGFIRLYGQTQTVSKDASP